MIATTASTSLRANVKSSFTGKAMKVQAKAPVSRVAAMNVVASAPSWMPGSTPPKHLDGSLPGDFGFDPLKLGERPDALAWFVQAELVHARFAMLGTFGILVPEALTMAGVLNVPVWYEAGATGTGVTDLKTLLVVQLLMMGWVETKRYYDYKNPKSQGASGSFLGFESFLEGSGNAGYPGKAFDPLGFAKDPERADELKLKEIKNGRLAMISMLGYYGQAAATGKGPVQNLVDHIKDPFHTCVTSNSNAVPFLEGGVWEPGHIGGLTL